MKKICKKLVIKNNIVKSEKNKKGKELYQSYNLNKKVKLRIRIKNMWCKIKVKHQINSEKI